MKLSSLLLHNFAQDHRLTGLIQHFARINLQFFKYPVCQTGKAQHFNAAQTVLWMQLDQLLLRDQRRLLRDKHHIVLLRMRQ